MNHFELPPEDADRWRRALDDALGDGARAPRRGRVLKAKFGYNPNSSSVGSVVTVLFWSAAAGTAVLNLVGALLEKRRQDPPEQDPGEAPP